MVVGFVVSSVAALFIMVYFSKASLARLYSQQTITTKYGVEPRKNGQAHYKSSGTIAGKPEITTKNINNK
jgi:hypothetical protein